MLGLAQIYQARNDKSKAIEYFEKVVDFAPKSSEAKLANNTLSSLKK
jgi:Tfp pilus assembly protein PilF